jgi:hypothetical protein
VSGNGLVEDIVIVSDIFLQGENLRTMIGRRRCLCTVLFLEASHLDMLDFSCYLGGVSVAVARIFKCSGIFLFTVILFLYF